MSTTNLLFLIALGVFLVGYGIWGILRRKVELGIGGGATGGGKPLFIIKLVGIYGVISGLACVIGGMIILVPLGIALINNQNTDTQQIQLSNIGGLLISILGFIFSWVMQLATHLGEYIRIHRNNT